MVAYRIGILLGIFSFVVATAQVSAQQRYWSGPDPVPPTMSVQSPSPLPGTSRWPVAELLPEQLTSPLHAPEDVPIATVESWFSPGNWGWLGETSGSLELGVNGSAGNAEAVSVKTGFELRRKTDSNDIKFDLSYTKATSDGVQTQHNALFNASYEMTIGQSKWELFVKEALEYDEFKAFHLRIAIHAGVV